MAASMGVVRNFMYGRLVADMRRMATACLLEECRMSYLTRRIRPVNVEAMPTLLLPNITLSSV